MLAAVVLALVASVPLARTSTECAARWDEELRALGAAPKPDKVLTMIGGGCSLIPRARATAAERARGADRAERARILATAAAKVNACECSPASPTSPAMELAKSCPRFHFGAWVEDLDAGTL